MCLCCHVGFLMASKRACHVGTLVAVEAFSGQSNQLISFDKGMLAHTTVARSKQQQAIRMCLYCHVGFLMASKCACYVRTLIAV